MSSASEILEILRERRSVRRFLPDPVPTEKILAILEAGSWAPSAGNRQDWQFTVVTSPTVKAEMAALVRVRWESLLEESDSTALVEGLSQYTSNFDWFAGAPVVLVVSGRKPEAFLVHLLGVLAGDVAGARTSAALAAQNILLAAHAMGLASCCLTGPLAAEDELRRVLKLGERLEIVCLIALGYAAETPPVPPRRPVEEVSRFVE